MQYNWYSFELCPSWINQSLWPLGCKMLLTQGRERQTRNVQCSCSWNIVQELPQRTEGESKSKLNWSSKNVRWERVHYSCRYWLIAVTWLQQNVLFSIFLVFSNATFSWFSSFSNRFFSESFTGFFLPTCSLECKCVLSGFCPWDSFITLCVCVSEWVHLLPWLQPLLKFIFQIQTPLW